MPLPALRLTCASHPSDQEHVVTGQATRGSRLNGAAHTLGRLSCGDPVSHPCVRLVERLIEVHPSSPAAKEMPVCQHEAPRRPAAVARCMQRSRPWSGRNVTRRSRAEWRLAFRALLRVAWVRLALWRWPFASVRMRAARRRLGRTRYNPERAAAADPYVLAWAVRAAAHRVPRASCLTQALALESLLADEGLTAEFRIGVARRADGSFEAHAWLERDGQVLIGGVPDLERFAVMPDGHRPVGNA